MGLSTSRPLRRRVQVFWQEDKKIQQQIMLLLEG